MSAKDRLYEAYEDAEHKYGARIIQITDGMNGYPRNLHYGLVGFDNFKDAEAAASEVGGEVRSLRRREGWQFYEDEGWISEPFNLLKYAYNHTEYQRPWTKEEKIECINEWRENLQQLRSQGEYVKPYAINELKKAFDQISNDEFIETSFGLTYDGSIPFEIIPKVTTGYHEDVWQYEVGVVADPILYEEED